MERLRAFAEAVGPTLMEPLPTACELRCRVEDDTWTAAADATVGCFADLADPSLAQNSTFVGHWLAEAYGGWRVPVGGMGSLSDALARVARHAGATVVTGAGVSGIETDWAQATVTWHAGSGWRSARLRSGTAPRTAFAGTLHVRQGYEAPAQAYREASAGRPPERAAGPGDLPLADGPLGPGNAGRPGDAHAVDHHHAHTGPCLPGTARRSPRPRGLEAALALPAVTSTAETCPSPGP